MPTLRKMLGFENFPIFLIFPKALTSELGFQNLFNTDFNFTISNISCFKGQNFKRTENIFRNIFSSTFQLVKGIDINSRSGNFQNFKLFIFKILSNFRS